MQTSSESRDVSRMATLMVVGWIERSGGRCTVCAMCVGVGQGIAVVLERF